MFEVKKRKKEHMWLALDTELLKELETVSKRKNVTLCSLVEQCCEYALIDIVWKENE